MGGAAVTAATIWRWRFRELRGATGALAAATLFLAAIAFVHLLPGILGLLTRGWVLAVAVAQAGSMLAFTRARPALVAAPRSDSPALVEPRKALVVCALLAATIAAWALTLMWQHRSTLTSVPLSFDMLTFDLPTVARWIQSGSVWVAHDLVPLQAHAAYPQTGDLLFLAVMLPWRSAFLTPLVTYPLLAATALGVYAVARELGSRRWSALVVACTCVVTPMFLVTAAADDLPDVFMWAMFASGTLFLLRHARQRVTSQLVLAGVALGLAFGAKWYGLTTIPIVVAVWAAAALRARHSARAVAHDASILIATIAGVGGFWLLRNTILYGDPLFPHQLGALGFTLIRGPADAYGAAYGFSIDHYLGDWTVWRRYILPEYRDTLRLAGALLVLGFAAASAWAAYRARRPGPSRVPDEVLAVGLSAVLIAAAYVVTPQTAVGPSEMPVLAGINARYAAPGLILAAAAIAWWLAHVGARAWPVASLLVAVASIDAFRPPLDVSHAHVALLAGLLVAASYTVCELRRRGSLHAPSEPSMIVGAAVALVVTITGGYGLGRRFASRGARDGDPAVDWIANHAGRSRVGITGSWDTSTPPVLAVFGTDLANTVQYVGRVEGGIIQHFSSYTAWRRALAADRLDFLLVGSEPEPLESDIERTWALEAHLQVAAVSSRFTLYRLPTRRP